MMCSIGGMPRKTARQLNNFASEYHFSRHGDGRVWRFQCHGQHDETLFGVMSNSQDGDSRVYGRLVFETSRDEKTDIEDANEGAEEPGGTVSQLGAIHGSRDSSQSTSGEIWKDHFDGKNGALSTLIVMRIRIEDAIHPN
jgi:hypothetical protein